MDKDLINLGVIKEKLRTFSEDRDWTQYHSPKNLVMALSVEVSELVEIFQWSNSRGIDEINDPKQKEKIKNRGPKILVCSPHKKNPILHNNQCNC